MKETKTMPNSEPAGRIQMLEEITPEVLSAVSSHSEIRGLPFYISDYVPNADDRLKAIIPLSVRHRKAMEATLRDVDPEFDPRNETDTYAVLIEALQNDPALFLRLNMDVSTTVAKGKRSKLPRYRIQRHLDRQFKEHGDLFAALCKANNERSRENALFSLFLNHVMESSKATIDTLLDSHGDPNEANGMDTGEADIGTTFIEDLSNTPAEPVQAPCPIPEALAVEWEQICIKIEVFASEMAENSDTRGLEELLAQVGKLQALAELANTTGSDLATPGAAPGQEPETVEMSAAMHDATAAMEHLLGADHMETYRDTLLTTVDETCIAIAKTAQSLAGSLRQTHDINVRVADVDAQMKIMSAKGEWDNVQELMESFQAHKSDHETAVNSAKDKATKLASQLGIEIEVFDTGQFRVRNDAGGPETELFGPPSVSDTDDVKVTQSDAAARSTGGRRSVGLVNIANEGDPETDDDVPEVHAPAKEPASTPDTIEIATTQVEATRPALQASPDHEPVEDLVDIVTPEQGAQHAAIEGDYPHVMTNLLRDDHIAISARFGVALDAMDKHTPIGSDALRVAAASRLAFDSYDSNVHEFVQMVGQASGEIPTLGTDDAEARALVLFGALLRPVILVKDIQLRQILGNLNLRRFGPVLTELQSEIGGLEYAFAPKIHEIAEAAGRSKLSRLGVVKRDLKAWYNQVKGRTGPCQPSTYMVHKMVTNGEVGTMVDKVLRDDFKVEDLDDIIGRYATEEIEARVREINRGAGTQSKGNFPQISWRFMKRHVGEGIDLLTSYRDLAAHDKHGEQTDLEMIQRRIRNLRKKLKAAVDKLHLHETFGKPGLVGAATQWLDFRLSEFDRLLEGDDIESYYTISAALGDNLDLLPTGCQPVLPESLRLDSALETNDPIEELEAEDRAVIVAVLNEHILLPLPAIEEKIARGGFLAAQRLAKRHIAVEADRNAMLARIVDARKSLIDDLIHCVSDTSRQLKDLTKIDLSYQEEIVRATDRLDETKKLLSRWNDGDVQRETEARGIVDIFQVPQVIAKAESLIAQVQQSVRDDQLGRLRDISEHNVSAETRDDIDRLYAQIETLSAEVIEDRLAAIRDGRPIGEMELEDTRSFEAFFPDFVEAASGPEWPDRAEAYEEAFIGDGHAQLKIGLDRQTAATLLMTAWFKLTRQLPSGTPRPASVESLLELLTFTSPKAQEPKRMAGLKQGFVHDLRMDCPTSDVFCPPVFGSSSGGRYRLLIVGPGALFEQIEDQLEKSVPTFVLVAERMSVEKRREFASCFRRGNIQALLIDEALIAYVAISTTRRLETLLDCTLPFGRFESYTDSAGKLPGEMFFGREDDIDIITSREAHGCLVYGGRQLGKSALLARVQESYHDLEKPFIVALDTVLTLGESNRPANEVWGIIARMLHDAEAGITTGRETSEEEILGAIRVWLDNHSSGRILILLDETDNFLSAEARNGYINLMPLKTLMENTHRSFKIVFAGLHNVRRIYDDPNSPLPHLGKPICVGPLNMNHEDKKKARDLVVEPMRAAGFVFENPMEVDNILAYVNHYPSLVQTFCKGLLQHLHRQSTSLGAGPLWKIPEHLVFSGVGFEQIGEQIREKFQLTLKLDPRYALITNVMALIRVDRGDESILRSGLRASEIREETLRHWPEHIQVVGESDFRSLLDELSQLGILSKISSESFGSARYVLRTRQVAQMLGQETDIIEALSTLYELEGKIDYDPSTYYRGYKTPGNSERTLRSPLSDSQFQKLLDPKAPGSKFITGLPIMGLRDAADAVRHILVGFGNRWGEMVDVSAVETNYETFPKEVRSVHATRGMKKVKLVFIRPRADQISQLINFVESRNEVTAGDVRPVFLLDATDEALRNLAVRRDAIVLQPWGHEMLRTYLHEEELDTLEKREIRDRILAATGGIPGPLMARVDKLSRLSPRLETDEIVPNFSQLSVEQYLPGASHKMVLSYMDSVSSKSEYDTLVGMLITDGCEKPTEVIEDLYTLGLLRLYDQKRGQIELSAFGRLVQGALEVEASGAI